MGVDGGDNCKRCAHSLTVVIQCVCMPLDHVCLTALYDLYLTEKDSSLQAFEKSYEMCSNLNSYIQILLLLISTFCVCFIYLWVNVVYSVK